MPRSIVGKAQQLIFIQLTHQLMRQLYLVLLDLGQELLLKLLLLLLLLFLFLCQQLLLDQLLGRHFIRLCVVLLLKLFYLIRK